MASSSLLKEPHGHAAVSERQNISNQHETSPRAPIPRSGFVHGGANPTKGHFQLQHRFGSKKGNQTSATEEAKILSININDINVRIFVRYGTPTVFLIHINCLM
jgi:hypothetical protein